MVANQSKSFKTVLFIITCILVVIAWCAVLKQEAQPVVEQYNYSGKTMGTTYSIRFFGSVEPNDLHALYTAIDDELLRINKLMSIYDPTSDISIFNASTQTEAVAISTDFLHVMTVALNLAKESNGAFDPTVANLVNLWGFGPRGRITIPPTEEEITKATAQCGWKHISLTDTTIQKNIPALELDLGAIAKGYGVDSITKLLLNSGISNLVVEIGGETRTAGMKPDGSSWRIGLQKPRYNATPGDSLIGIIQISDKAIATSGDYQNYFIDEDKIIHSHIIDPRTGHPAKHTTASVTVVADSCTIADGLATALYVMGPEEGIPFIEQQSDIEALFVMRKSENDFAEISSSGFASSTNFEQD